ncbi:MAG: FAD-dependent oxidoreductase [Candidatus Wallbacteria bacterium]|nr:FAD-dependent oxidoreductase [Candidatus Wallbacteria bacterium]
MKHHECQVAVVGAGPAGCAAAIQLTRAGIDTLLVEKAEVGGLLCNAGLIENYPGFPEGIRGLEMAGFLKLQLRRLGVRLLRDEIISVRTSGGFMLQGNLHEIESKYLILATGTRPADPGINVPAIIRRFVDSEIRPALKCSDRTIAIVGAGDAAFDYALNFSRKNRVILISRSGTDRCLPILKKRVTANDRIELLRETSILRIDKGRLKKISLGLKSQSGSSIMEVDLLIFAIGRIPEDRLLQGWNWKKKLEEGKLFQAGDLINGLHRQAVIAAGDGMKAALSITGELNENNR